MSGLVRLQQVLRCAGRVGDSEKLLLSVLRQQSTSFSEADPTLLLQNLPESQDVPLNSESLAESVLQTDDLHTPQTEHYRHFFDLLSGSVGSSDRRIQSRPYGSQQHSPTVASQRNTKRPTQSAPLPLLCSTPSQAKSGDTCFSLAATEFNPDLTVPEILAQWELFVEKYGVNYTEQLSPSLRRREAALLNSKLDDPVLGLLAGMKSATPGLKSVPTYIAEVLQSETRNRSALHKGAAPYETARRSPSIACYGLPHFSAELGDVTYLQSLLRQLPQGFLMRWFSTPPDSHVGVDAAERAFAHAGIQESASCAEGGAVCGFFDSTPQRPTRCSFEQVAIEYPDHFGLYLSHLAALNGHIEYLQFLASILGEKFVLQEQCCAAPISSSFSWGVQRYTTGLTAVQCAVAAQQVTLLEWIATTYPEALRKMRPRQTLDALTMAAMAPDDKTDVFDFFVSHSMPPLNQLEAGNKDRDCGPRSRPRDGAVGVYDEVLQEAGVLRLLFAAAEVGNVNVLRWFDMALGSCGVRELCDVHGVTILHHCARGRNAKLLEVLLPPAATLNKTVSSNGESPWSSLDPRWVDVEDDQGRTPAVWCVMGSKKNKGCVETLEVLRRAGSQWPRQRHDGVSLFDVAIQNVSRHSKLARYIKAHMQ